MHRACGVMADHTSRAAMPELREGTHVKLVAGTHKGRTGVVAKTPTGPKVHVNSPELGRTCCVFQSSVEVEALTESMGVLRVSGATNEIASGPSPR